MKKTLFLIIALAGAFTLHAEEKELYEEFDFSALEQEIAKSSSEEESAAEERELKALFSEFSELNENSESEAEDYKNQL